MIVYADSSVIARAYLPDEVGHAEAIALIEDPDIAVITGSWTRVEVAGALVRSARTGRGNHHPNENPALTIWEADSSENGPVTFVSVAQAAIEAHALALVRAHGLRAMDAWHLAAASLSLPELADVNEKTAFASRDTTQAKVATILGFALA